MPVSHHRPAVEVKSAKMAPPGAGAALIALRLVVDRNKMAARPGFRQAHRDARPDRIAVAGAATAEAGERALFAPPEITRVHQTLAVELDHQLAAFFPGERPAHASLDRVGRVCVQPDARLDRPVAGPGNSAAIAKRQGVLAGGIDLLQCFRKQKDIAVGNTYIGIRVLLDS